MIAKLPSWFVGTKRIQSNNCLYIYKENLGAKLGVEEFLSFQECRDQIRIFKFKTYTDYKINRKPNWPISPEKYYKEWKGWDDFLGRAPRPSFTELKIKIRALNIKTKKEYIKYRKEKKTNWPSRPDRFYKEWKGRYDFFGTSPLLGFAECQNEVKKNKIKNSIEYSEKRKPNWPSEPENVYKEYWKGWDHFLGIQKWLNFEQCRKEIKKYKIKHQTEYRKKRRPNWPSYPKKVYKESWRGWSHFLSTKDKVWPEFEQCRKEIKKYKIKGIVDYRLRRKSNWPSEPKKVYKKQWKDWHHYLSFYPFLAFEECRKEVKKCKIKSSSEYKRKRKPNWPSNPNVYYKEWKGYDHFLGK